MPERFKKKSGKFRGTRTCGGGDPKNRRGKGCKGGWGRAGMKKHRFTYATKYEPGKFGSGAHGFIRPNKKKIQTINIYEIENQAEKGPFIFYGKVLGNGEITQPVEVHAFAFTKNAKEKIEKVGGKIEILQSTTKSKEKNAETKEAVKEQDGDEE
ncbi:50S ribosomal protein L15 [Candidatus Micrarchaeota archaeon]|nr:50S ribosomal protein L15 [Candidatus Micrarchaeota archaeon]